MAAQQNLELNFAVDGGGAGNAVVIHSNNSSNNNNNTHDRSKALPVDDL